MGLEPAMTEMRQADGASMKIGTLKLLSIALVACATPVEVSDDLRLDRPFGQSWSPSPPMVAAYRDTQREECAAVFDPATQPDDLAWCIEELPFEATVRPETVPKRFRDGHVTAHLDDDRPTAFEFLFAPWFGSVPEAPKALDGAEARRERVERLAAELTRLLGAADSRLGIGFSETGIADDGPCQIWLREPVGVILCENVATTPDAGGMLLVFVRVDRSRSGSRLREIATSAN